MTSGLRLMPSRYRHRPTEIMAMQFTPATRTSLYSWLAQELGTQKFSMTPTHLVIETTHGDSRDAGLGCWVIRRPTRDGYEFYPVENEVIADGYEPATDAA